MLKVKDLSGCESDTSDVKGIIPNSRAVRQAERELVL